MPYNIDKKKCKQSDGDSGTHVLSYTDGKGKDHDNCHTSKKGAQGQIAAIEGDNLAETDDMVFGGGGDPESEGEVNEDDEMDEALIREYIREKLIVEAIVSYEGEEYDIPDDEAATIKQMIEFGDAEPAPENSRVFNPDNVSKKILTILGEETGEKVISILGYFSDNIRRRALKIISNNVETFKAELFSVTPAVGQSGQVPGGPWLDIATLDEKGLGKGELALSLLMKGVTPDGGGGAHDLSIAGVGDVHVKDVGGDGKSAFQNPDLRMGKQINSSDRTNWYLSLQDGIEGWQGKSTTEAQFKENAKNILDSWAKLVGEDAAIASADVAQYDAWADQWQEDFTRAFSASESWGENTAALMIVDSKTGRYFLAGPDQIAPSRIDQGKWRAGLATKRATRWSTYLKKHVKPQLGEVKMLKSLVASLLTEDLTGSDKSDIKRMIKKEIDSAATKREIDRVFKKNFDKELKKALGSSFFGTPGKINKFVIDEIHDEVEKILGDKATREMVVQICKDVIVKLYRELSFTYKPVIQRLKV